MRFKSISIMLIPHLFMILLLFGQDEIFKTKLKHMGVQEATGWYFTGFQTRTSGDTVFLMVKPNGAPAIDIVYSLLKDTEVQDFDFLGDTLASFSTWSDAAGWVYLRAETKNGLFQNIIRTKLSGTGVQDFSAGANEWINGFYTSTDGEYVYLHAVANTIGIEEEKSQDQEIGVDKFVFALNNVIPNPVIHSAQISYSIAKPCEVKLNIYDVSGRLVKNLVNQKQNPNVFRLIWHGDDNLGRKLSSGVYFIKFRAGNFTAMKKIILVR